MPIYEFRCADCGLVFERIWTLPQHIVGSALCPKCQSPAPRIPSSAAFTVSGFSAKNGYSGSGK